MNNGTNSWNVRFSHIMWLQRLFETHDNVATLTRHDDIVFEIDRKAQRDHLTILCCNEYVMSLSNVHRALHEFGKLNLIYVGGGWCGYTSQAKEFCLAQKMGLFVTNEMSGALWKDEYWQYHQKDKDGNPIRYFKAS